ncbi:MAG: cbb3-type cytochrome oxidase assembly protein CcoS [Betaproteobacteria bacterium]|nr:cbb3-type cytochrome oxidase assembly protein CcoS [Betaproteobacteria bacterium]
MDILYLLIPLSLVLVFVIAALFWWSLKTGQYEDLEGPGHRILMDDDDGGGEERKASEKPNAGSVASRRSGRS